MAATDPLPPGDRPDPATDRAAALARLPVRTIHVYDHPVTLEEFLALPDPPSGRRAELDHGRVVEMSPVDNLQGAVRRALDRRLVAYVEARGGDAFGLLRDDIGFVVDPGGPHPVRFPDLAFIPAARWARLAVVDPAAGPGLPRRPTAGDPYASGYPVGAPDLAVEVAGKDDYLPELRAKAHAYLGAGARLVWWIVPPHPGRRARAVVWSADGRERGLRVTDELLGEPVLPGFRVRPADLWAGAGRPRPAAP
jgi:Uma2 family endonuclease